MNVDAATQRSDRARPSLTLKLRKPVRRRNAACRACQHLKHRCEFGDESLSKSCKRCTLKNIECVMPATAPKRRRFTHSAEPASPRNKSTTQPAQAPNDPNVASLGNQTAAAVDAQGHAPSKRRPDRGSPAISPAADSEQPPAGLPHDTRQAVTRETSTTSTKSISTAPASNHPPPGTMLFPISQIQQVLDIYDRRKQRIQYLEAQVDHLERNLHNNSALGPDQDGPEPTQRKAKLDQQMSLAAALGGALVRQAKITDTSQLYKLLEHLGVDQSHYGALDNNEEFQKLFPASYGNGSTESRSKTVQVQKAKESAPEKTLDTLDHTLSASNDVIAMPN